MTGRSLRKMALVILLTMAVAAVHLTAYAPAVLAMAQTQPDAIPFVSLASDAPGQLTVTWEAPELAPTDYRIRWANSSQNWLSYRDDNEAERGNEYSLVDVSTLTLDNLTPGDTYKVQMRSRYYNVDRSVHESSGPWTEVITQKVKNHPPAAPTGLTASQVTRDTVTVTWTDPQDARITGYRILRGSDAESRATIEPDTGGPSTSYTDSTVEPETTYHYAVIALNTSGAGESSGTISATTTAAPKSKTPPQEPQRVGGQQAQTSVELRQVINAAPTVANMIPDQLARAGTAFSYAFPDTTFADEDSDPLTYTATKPDDTALPAWLVFDAGTLTFSGTPQTADEGTVSVKVTASDGNGGSVSDEFVITVRDSSADITPPTLLWAAVGSENLRRQFVVLQFSENVQGSSLPPGSAFTVTADGIDHAVTSVIVDGLIETLVLVAVSPLIRSGQAVVVTYTDPTSGDDAIAMQDAAGNDVATFTTGVDGVPAAVNNSTAHAPTGAPTITGTAQVGQTLTAVTAAIMDDNGLDNVSYMYQWIRTASGTDTDIADATASTYTLVAADVGATIKVKVSFTDDDDDDETLTSAATAAVLAASTAHCNPSDPTELWCGNLTVGTVSSGSATAFGYSLVFSTPFGSVAPLTFTYGGATITVTQLGYNGNRLQFGLGSALGAGDFSLEIGTGATKLPFAMTGPADLYMFFGHGLSWSSGETVPVKLLRVNTAPTLGTPIPDQTALAGTAFSYAFPEDTFADADSGDTLTYSATRADNSDLPTWLSFDPATRTFSGMPQVADLGTVSVKVTASDGYGESVSDTFDIITVVTAPAFGLDQGTVQVSSLGGVGTGTTNISTDYYAQSFTTPGTASDSFVLFGVRVALLVPAGITVGASIWSNDASASTVDRDRDVPGSSVGVLSGPGSLADTLTVGEFVSSSGVTLAGGTRYWLVVSRDPLGASGRVKIPYLDAVGVFADAGTGWSLGRNAFDEDDADETIDWAGLSGPYPFKMEIVTGPTRSVAENTTSGNLGDPIVAVDADGDTLVYSVAATTESDAAAHLMAFNRDFMLNAATGQITVKSTAVIDFETRSVYKVLYRVSDREDSSGAVEDPPVPDDSLTLAVTVTNANEAGAVTITGAAQVGQTLTASVSDPDGDPDPSEVIWQWSRSDAHNGTFTDITSATEASYVPVGADVGMFLRVTVTFTDDANNPETLTSAATAAVGAAANTAAAGAPTITGVAQVGETLTAGTAAITDGDGLTGVSYMYQWIRTASGTDTDIAGAAAGTYTLVQADLGATIKVRVTFTDDANNPETLTSAATAAVGAAANTPAAGAPTITGVAQVGETLTAGTAAITDGDGLTGVSYMYQWIRTASGTDTDIAGAAAGTYTLVQADLGATIKVRVTFTDDANNPETLTSAATAAVGAAANTAAAGAPTITGVAQVGETLTAGTAAITDGDGLTGVSYMYQWIRVAADTTETDIAGAAAGTYTLVQADLGATIKVRVTFTDDANNPETLTSAATAAVGAAANTAAAGAPTITGVAQVGETLTAGTAAITDGDGLTGVSYMYQWIRTASGTDTDIAGAAAGTYTLVQADLGATIKVRVTFTDDANNPETLTSAATAAVGAAANTAAAGAPTITGVAQVGETLTAGTAAITDGDGLTGVSYMYQWIRTASGTDTDIAGAAAGTYTLVQADLGATIKVRVTFTDDANNPETLTSAATAAVGAAANTAAAGAPTITGVAQVGETLTAGTAAITDGDGLTGVSYMYQWIRTASGTDTDIAGAAAGTYTLVQADLGATIKVRVTFTDDANNPETLTSAATAAVGAAANTPAAGAPTITGVAQVGETLTAGTAAITDGDGLTGVSYMYQWIRTASGTDTDIAGAAAGTYTLVQADLGATIKVRVTFTDDANNPETLTSAATAAVGAAANTAAAGAPTITGVAQVGETLTAGTAAITDGDGLTGVSYMYQWIRTASGTDTDIAGAAAGTYTLVQADLGATIKVRVTFTDDANNPETLTSAATAAVGAAANTAAAGAPTITGVAQVGETLTAGTAAITDGDGLTGVSYMYQWIRTASGTDTDIAGAAAGTYTLVQADLGATIKVRVTFTDDANNPETLTSAATAAVGAAANTPAAGAPTITGVAQVGETLTAGTAAITDGDGLTGVSYMYQWIRTASGTDTDIAGAAAGTYTLVQADLGATIKVRVTFTDDANNPETLTSAATAAVGAAANTAAAGAPTITGVAQVGETLTAGTAAITDGDGLTGVSYMYQWIRTASGTDTDIAGAAAGTYTLVQADLGATIKVRVTFTDDANNPETLTSAATAAVGAAANTPAAGAPTITGVAQVGETLTAGTAAITDGDGLTGVSYMYQWIRTASGTDTDIAGAAAGTYTLVQADLGATIKVRVTFTDDANNPETLTSAATAAVGAAVNTAAAGAPTITGVAQVGETLTAGTAAITDGDGLTSVSYMYQWIRTASGTDTDIAGAAAGTYTLVQADLGATIKVRVTFTDDANNPETLTSAATAAVGAAANTAAAGAPTITGVAQVGETLTAGTAAITDGDGLTSVSYMYQWIRTASGTDTDIAGAAAGTYTLVQADLGATIKVRVTFTDDANNPETLTSAATAAVLAASTGNDRNGIVVTIEQVPDGTVMPSGSAAGDTVEDGSTFVEGTWAAYRLVFTKIGAGLDSGGIVVGVSYTAHNDSPMVSTHGAMSAAEFSLPLVEVWDTVVKILDNDIGNPEGTLTITITECKTDGCVIGTPSQITLTITDDDGGPDAAPPGPPDQPTLVCASSGGGYDRTGIAVIWDAPSFVGGAPVLWYELRYRQASEFTNNRLIQYEWEHWPRRVAASPATLSTDLTGLTQGLQYTVQVRAVNANGPGPWSESGYLRVGQTDEMCDILNSSTDRRTAASPVGARNSVVASDQHVRVFAASAESGSQRSAIGAQRELRRLGVGPRIPLSDQAAECRAPTGAAPGSPRRANHREAQAAPDERR